jgi:hypothetical protein
MAAIPPGILGTAAFKTMQTDIAKIDEMIGAAVSQLTGWKGSVEAATTATITLSGAQTIDGVSVVAEEQVLVKNQTDGIQNGIYICKGDAWERTQTMLLGSSAAGAAVYVTKGTANGDKVFICTNDMGSDIVGTSVLTFIPLVTSPAGSDTQVQFNDGGVMAGDSGLTFDKTGNVLTAQGGFVATTGDVLSSSALSGLTLTKLTGTAATLAGTVTIVARQGVITVTDASLASDVAANLTVTATGMVGATNLILVGVNSMVASAGGPVLAVTARTPPNSFVITTTNCDGNTAMGATAMTIGYVIM